ncbi:MAG: ArnT family glycosyltransferase [bacterium]
MPIDNLNKLFQQIDTKRLMLFVVILAMVFRFAFILCAQNIGDPTNMDAQNYLRIAENLVAGKGFKVWSQPSLYVAPLYPTVLAALRFIFGDSIWVIKTFQALLGTASVWLVYVLAKELLAPPAATFSAAIFALHPEIIALAGFIYTEVVFIFLLLVTLIFTVKAIKRGTVLSYCFAGFSLGLTNLCRGTLMYFPIFLLLMILLYRSELRRQRIIGVAVLGFSMALTMSPWTIRNYVQFKAFVPVASGLGDVLWTGNYLPFDGEFRYEETQNKIHEIVGDTSFVERDRILIAEAKKNILAQPVESAWLMVRKAFRYWLRVYENVPSGEQRDKNWLIFGVLAGIHFSILSLGVFGGRKLPFRNPTVGMFIALILYYTLIHTLTLPVVRYRLPLLPILCIFAAAGLQIAVNVFQRNPCQVFANSENASY